MALPNYNFPEPPPDSIISQEPADLETSFRRGYFTNYSREEVISWYKNQFEYSDFLGIRLPTLLLNYPPENAQTIIRDQTSSSYLQELVHPFRESLYINGFKPLSESGLPAFTIEGETREQKIIIKYLPSNVWVREGIFIASAVMAIVIYNACIKLFKTKHE